MKNPYDIIVRPLITEKTTKLTDSGKYSFEVKQGVNKIEVKKPSRKYLMLTSLA